jgi:hypothetical protein
MIVVVASGFGLEPMTYNVRMASVAAEEFDNLLAHSTAEVQSTNEFPTLVIYT